METRPRAQDFRQSLGEGLDCRGHGTVASKVGAILDGKAFDDVGACGLVVGVSQDE